MTEEETQGHVKRKPVVLNLSDSINRIVCFKKNANSRDKKLISDILCRNNLDSIHVEMYV